MNNTVRRMLSIGWCVHVLFVIPAIAGMPAYNPLAVSSRVVPEIVDCEVTDGQRQRDIPIRVYLPPVKSSSPVILFSHSLGGSREGSAYLGKHWAARGYVAVFLQHPGSDISVWKDKSRRKRMAAMREAGNGRNFLLRVKDIPTVLDQLERWNKTDKHVLAGKLNFKKIGMSGHSFGAKTTQAVSGQKTKDGREIFTDPRITAAVVMSPKLPATRRNSSSGIREGLATLAADDRNKGHRPDWQYRHGIASGGVPRLTHWRQVRAGSARC